MRQAKTLKLVKKEDAGEVEGLSCSALTDVGRKRANNEDNFVVLKKGGAVFLAVFDGMGGMEKGEVASSIAAQTANEMFESEADFPHPEAFIVSVLKKANEKIFQYAEAHNLSGKMGTTAAAAFIKNGFIKNGVLSAGNVGDSRVYLLKDGKLLQITHDHTLVAYQLENGLISEKEARESTQKNVLTRALGVKADVEVETYPEVALNEKDKVLLCSDGLYNMVSEKTIESVLKSNLSTEEKARALIDRANRNGGEDNITVIIAESAPLRKEQDNLQGGGKKQRRKFAYIIVLLVLAVALLALYYLKFVKKAF